MLNVACCGGAGCCSREEVKESVKEVVVFVSPTVGGSFVGAPIGGGGVSSAVLGFMVVVVCSVSNEKAANVVQRGVRGAVSRSESITAFPLKSLLYWRRVKS